MLTVRIRVGALMTGKVEEDPSCPPVRVYLDASRAPSKELSAAALFGI